MVNYYIVKALKLFEKEVGIGHADEARSEHHWLKLVRTCLQLKCQCALIIHPRTKTKLIMKRNLQHF